MSLPKEPRQIMINLMYLVLTVMLALNVSAEILNAFTTLDTSLEHSNNIVASANANMLATIDEQAKAYEQYEPYFAKAQEVKKISSKFYDYVEDIKQSLIENSGGLDEENLPVGLKDKDVTTRMLVDDGAGEKLKTTLLAVRDELLQQIEDEAKRKTLSQNIPLKVNEIPPNSDKKTWSQFTFQQMPVAAVLPLLSKIQNDMRVSETAVLNLLLEGISRDGIVLDAYEAVIAADQSYIIRGDEYKAEIFLGAYSSTSDNLSVSVDGRKYPVRDGKATVKFTPNSIGEKKHRVNIQLTDPISKETKNYTKDFSFEVGERSVAVSLDKMNVFYVGVDNPISISAAGVPTDQVRVSADGVTLQNQGGGKYTAKPTSPGKAKITVSGGGLPSTVFDYVVKPIPTPVVKLGNKTTGSMTVGEIKVYKRLTPILENFDFNARCSIRGFELARAPKKDEPKFSTNPGGDFSSETLRIISKAKRGDTFYFDKIKVRCPGDGHNRDVPGLIFRIR